MTRKVITLLLLGLLFTGCTLSPQDTGPTPMGTIRGHITFAGSTTVQPLADKIGQAFVAQYPGISLDIAAGGSSVGIRAIHDGTVDIGMASRTLTPSEVEGVTPNQIAVDVIAVVVPASNPVRDLTLEQLQAIYLGKIDNWREVGGEDQPITVVARDKNSGTRGAFDQIVLDKLEPAADDLRMALTAGDMAAMVLELPNAIGYVGFGNIEEGLALVKIDGIEPSEASAKSGAYQLVRPLLLISGPLTQPVAEIFIEYALSDAGQQIVVDNGWVSAR